MGKRDGIAEPWGTRTPYGPGEPWPVRVDSHLADGLRPDDVDRWVRSAAVLHSNGDGLDIAVQDGRIVGVRGRADDRVNHGRLDPKDLFGWQANSSPDRLTTPLVRENGELVEADWDTAMDRIVRRSKELLDEHGPGALGFYTTGQLFAEEYYTLAAIARGGIGTNHLDGNTRLCTATAAEALKESFGCDGQPAPTPTSTTPTSSRSSGTTSPRPRRCCGCACWTGSPDPTRRRSSASTRADTPVARAATVHLAPLPGTNVALMNGAAARDHRPRLGRPRLRRRAHRRLRRTRRRGRGVPARAGRGDLRSRRRRHPRRRRSSSAPPSGCCPPCCRASTSPTRRPPPPSRSTTSCLLRGMLGQARLRRAADERPAHRAEHPRVRRRRRPGRVPQLGERRRTSPSWPAVERRASTRSRTTRRRRTRCRCFRYAEQGSIRMLWVSGTNPAVSLPELARIRVDPARQDGCSWWCRTSS